VAQWSRVEHAELPARDIGLIEGTDVHHAVAAERPIVPPVSIDLVHGTNLGCHNADWESECHPILIGGDCAPQTKFVAFVDRISSDAAELADINLIRRPTPLMAEELCRTITGKEVSLKDVGPPSPVISKTLDLVKQSKPIRVVAMPPFDKLIGPALKRQHPNAVVEVVAWPTAGKSLADLERAANQTVRAMNPKPDLVVLAVPRAATADSDEQFVNSYSWIMNWSLSFGHQEWDCFVVHPSVAAPGPITPRDNLVRQLVQAQHLSLVDRAAGDDASAQELLAKWLGQQ
jgi:hypothetical protein